MRMEMTTYRRDDSLQVGRVLQNQNINTNRSRVGTPRLCITDGMESCSFYTRFSSKIRQFSHDLFGENDGFLDGVNKIRQSDILSKNLDSIVSVSGALGIYVASGGSLSRFSGIILAASGLLILDKCHLLAVWIGAKQATIASENDEQILREKLDGLRQYLRELKVCSRSEVDAVLANLNLMMALPEISKFQLQSSVCCVRNGFLLQQINLTRGEKYREQHEYVVRMNKSFI